MEWSTRRGDRDRVKPALRFIRKHRIALIALAVYNLVLFSPVVFSGLVLSPNEIFYKYEPWASVRPAGFEIYNGLLIDPPTSYYTLMSMLKYEPAAFHWNPYIASGAPGFGSSASAVLSPFISLPAFLLPLPWVFTGIVFLKLNVAFVFAYFWLRQERLGKKGAAIGAIVIAGSLIYAVRWLWQMTNATAIYPALLWIVKRGFDGKRISLSAVVVLAAAYLVAGFPAGIAYGVYLALAYAVFLAIRLRRVPRRALATAVAGGTLGFMIVSPSVMAFARWLLGSGYLEMRAQASSAAFPLSHWPSFFHPLRLGTPAGGVWKGDRALGLLDNYVEATIYLGVIAVVLAAIGGFTRRRGGAERFWGGAAIVIVLAIFNIAGVGSVVGPLPGFKYSMMGRATSLLPLPIGYLAGLGTAWLIARVRRRQIVAAALAILVAAELSFFAMKFFPYIERKLADVPSTPTLDALREDKPPFRVAPFMDYLWPNTSELFRIEDVRSHFTSDSKYRQLLLRIDPAAWSGKGTYLGFHSLSFKYEDPIVGMLGIRWLLEHKSIDVVKWQARGKTTPGVEQSGTIHLQAGVPLRRTLDVTEPFWALEVPLEIAGTGHVHASIEKDGQPVWSRSFTADDVRAMGRVYLPIRPAIKVGERITFILWPEDVQGFALGGADGGVYFGRVNSAVIFDRELPDGRLFRNLAEVPRFRAASRVRKLTGEQFLAATDIDLGSEAVITDESALPATTPDARVELQRYGPSKQRIATDSPAPFFLASSERLSNELRVTVDGREVPIAEINTLFAGVSVPAGKHEVVFERRIGRGWWPVAAAGLVIWLGILIVPRFVHPRMRKSLIALTLFLAVPAFADTALFGKYEAVRQALLQQKLADVQTAATELAAEATKAKNAEITDTAESVAAAKDLKAARNAFAALSTEMIKVRNAAKGERPMIGFCPMVNKSWLQAKGEIGNPYDPAMAQCGMLKD